MNTPLYFVPHDVQEIEDKLASLRNRLEQGLPPDTAQEQAEKRRRAMEQQIRRQSSSRPPRSVSYIQEAKYQVCSGSGVL